MEDEALVALEIQESLERMGYSVPEIVDSGDEVLGAVLRVKPELVVMDIHLKSYIDGVDAASRLRMISSAPIIYITAYGTRGVRDRAQRTGPVAYLLKPLDEAVLRKTIEQALSDTDTEDSSI